MGLQGLLSEQDRVRESDLGMAAGGERITHTPWATYSHFLVLLQQQSRKVTQLDDKYCKLLTLLIIPEMERGIWRTS